MPDLKLLTLLEAAQPSRLEDALQPFFGPGAEPVAIESTRLQAPLCYWVVYRSGTQRVTLKSFFSEADFARYSARLTEYYPDQIGQPGHPAGGLAFLPDLNGILWQFPFDPALLGLHRCLDGAWIAQALRRPEAEPLEPEVVNYRPEIGALLAYREPRSQSVVAYGKSNADQNCGLIYLAMQCLWRSPARQRGELRLAQPLAFRPEAGLLLQAPVPGRPISRERNRGIFLDLVSSAGSALAAIHGTDIPLGRERPIDYLLARLENSLDEIALSAPALHRSTRRLISQIAARAGRSEAAPLVASHGDFKYDQFLEADGQFTLIDFELFCRAEPALDLGTFCAYLPPSSPRGWQDGAAAELLRETFLKTYEEVSNTPIDFGRLGLYESAMLATRGLSHIWAQQSGWQLHASQMLDLAWERLVNPEPQPGYSNLITV